jgi:hypothetical protein
LKTARGLGLLRGFGGLLRDIFKQRGWYQDRRSLQIAASIAIGFMGLTLGFAIIRFISLHEVDAWNANAPHRPALAAEGFCFASSQD